MTKYNNAYIFFPEEELVDNANLKDRIDEITNAAWAQGLKIAFMPDSHATKDCCVGLTMQLTDKVNVDYVSSDIGCGVTWIKLPTHMLTDADFKKIDDTLFINDVDIMLKHEAKFHFPDYEKLLCVKSVSQETADKSLATLGRGNHFIEIDKDQNGDYYLVVHSGSRNLGAAVFKHYKKVQENWKDRELFVQTINLFKAHGQEKLIPQVLKVLKQATFHPDYLSGQNFHDYLHDLKVVNDFAILNRTLICQIIFGALNLPFHKAQLQHCIHNIIGPDDQVLRKGAISAKAGQAVLIPLNMRDGCVFGYAKCLAHWNDSCPHGAGRPFSRTVAREKITLEQFKQEMTGIYSSTVSEKTLDEAPSAYKDANMLKANLDNVDIVDVWKTVYNFKV